MIIFGEVGLSGEVRAVSMAEQRLQEARKLGFTSCMMPSVCKKNLNALDGIKVIGVNSVQDAIGLL